MGLERSIPAMVITLEASTERRGMKDGCRGDRDVVVGKGGGVKDGLLWWVVKDKSHS